MKYAIAAVPFVVILVSFLVILGTSANAASDISKGDVQKGAPSAVVAVLTCSMIVALMFGVFNFGNKMVGGGRSRGSSGPGGGGRSALASMPSTPYPAA